MLMWVAEAAADVEAEAEVAAVHEAPQQKFRQRPSLLDVVAAAKAEEEAADAGEAGRQRLRRIVSALASFLGPAPHRVHKWFGTAVLLVHRSGSLCNSIGALFVCIVRLHAHV